MKKNNVVVMVLVLLCISNVFGQLQRVDKYFFPVKTDSLAIAYSKTTNLIFPYEIISVDRGTNDLLVQKVKGVENILQLKAAKENFAETNLSVITADGQLYSFVVNYNEEHPILNKVVNYKKTASAVLGITESKNEKELHSYAELAFYDKRKLHHVKDNQYQVKFRLDGVFINENIMYYRLRIVNQSTINYEIDQLRFFIRDQRKVKRTASQEIELLPLYVYNQYTVIEGKTEVCQVFALEKFTIPDKKYLVIQLMEKQGGRHLELQIKNNKLKKLGVLPKL